jgi:hypothetical protein
MDIDLSKVIAYSKDSLQSRALMRAIMLDLYPGKTREMNVLLDVYESGVPRQIKKDGTITELKYAQYIRKIVNDYGLQEQWAVAGLNAWIDLCIGIGTSNKLYYTFIPQQLENLLASDAEKIETPNQPKCVVEGVATEFELKTNADGTLEIKKFKGFDEDTIIIPNTINGKMVTGIGQYAYKSCKSVKKVVINEGIEYILDGAFAYCTSLKEVKLPSTLKQLGQKKVITQKEKENFMSTGKSRCLTLNPVIGVFAMDAIEHISLPTGLSFLGERTFSSCSYLQKIDLPECTKEILGYTFNGCTSLEIVNMPDGLISIGEFAFCHCKNMKSIVFPETLRQIKDSAFSACTALSDVQLNEGLCLIGNYVFENCRAMKEILFPRTLVTIGKKVFEWTDNYNSARNGFNPYLTIYCYAGSKGLEYARNEGIPMKDASKR